MKNHRTLGVMLLALGLGLQSCGEGTIPNQCLLGGAIEHSVQDGVGRFTFNEELREYVINYHVPGTIDSFWTGVVCQSIPGTIELPEEGEVVFTGDFLDDNDRFNPNVQIGGQEFFYLNLSSVVRKVDDSDPTNN